MATKAKQALKGFSPVRRFAWNKELETQGVWREIEDGAAKLKIARFNNPDHVSTLQKLRLEHEEELRNPDTEEAQKLTLELSTRAMAQSVLVGWEGILDEEGKELPYSAEAAFELLTELDEFSGLVFNLSLENEQYRKFQEDKAAKN